MRSSIRLDGREGPFRGIVHLRWLHTIGEPKRGMCHCCGERTQWFDPIRLEPGTLEDGMYWIMATGSQWGFVQDSVMHLEMTSHTIYGVGKQWASGTRGPQAVYGMEWVDFVRQFPTWPH